MKKCDCDPPKALEIKCPGEVILFRKVEIPAEMGDDVTYPPRPGMYRNVLLVYKANNHVYMYSSDGMPTFISDGGEGTKDYEDLINKPSIDGYELSGDVTLEDIGVIDAIDDALEEYTPTDELADVALSGDYDDLINKPTISTVNDATLTITRNNVSAGTFTANSATDTSINIAVPTATSDLTNDSGFITNTVDNLVNYYTKTETDSAIGVEATNRENADQSLQGQIDALASASDVVDVVGTYAELQAYDTSHLNDNDIIKVLTDETHNDAISYYRWDTDTDTFSYIGSQGPFYTKAESDATFVPQTRTVNNKALSSNITLTAADVHALPDSTVIPTVNNATLTIKKNGTNVATFTANSATDIAADISVPTATSDLTNDSGFLSAGTDCASGSSFQITGIEGAPLTLTELAGNATQNGTPTPDAPVAVNTTTGENVVKITGKNLYTTADATIVGSQTVIVDANSYTATTTGNWQGRLRTTVDVQPNTDMRFDWKCDGPASGQSIVVIKGVQTASTLVNSLYYNYYLTHLTSSAFNTGLNTQITIELYVSGNNSTAGDYRMYELSLTLGSTATSYEPYQGQEFPIDLSSKNLFDKSAITTGKILDRTNGTLVNQVSYDTSDFMPVKAGEKYTYTGFNVWYASYYDTNKAFVSTPNNSTTITIPTGVAYVRCSLLHTNLDTAQFEHGTQATSYAEFYSYELAKIGNFQDYIYKDNGTWKIHKEITKLDLSTVSASNWASYASGNNTVFYAIVPSAQYGSESSNPIISDRFISEFSATNGRTFLSGSQMRINFCTNIANNPSDWITWLASNPTTVYYALATPTTTEITDSTLLAQLNFIASLYEGVNNIMLVGTGAQGEITVCHSDVSRVAITGSYNDLTDKPTIPTVNDATLTIQKNGVDVTTFTANSATNTTANIVVPTKTSDLTNDGADNTSTYVEADELATVATSGSYNDLSNKPTIPAAQVNSDWNASSGVAQILNKPTLATVATSGSYNDLSNKPTIPTVNNATLTIQKNGTNVQTFTANQATNATANITVPTATSDLTNDSGFLTSIPIASENALGGIKVGAGLAISSGGVLSATGGGVADSVAWGHITGTMADQTDLTTALAAKANSADLATVATSGDYDDLTDKPTIGNATLTIQKNGTTVNTFTANASANVTANIAVPTKTSDITNDGSDGTAQYLETDETAYKTASIPYGQCDSTSTATVYTATVPGVTELRDGVCMWLKNGVVTSASGFTININNLGAKPVYNNMAAATRDTTIWNVNYTMLFVYDSTRVEGGCWILYRGYNSDNNTIGYQLRTNSQSLPMSSVVYRYRLLFTSADGTHYVPANNSTSTNATSSRTVCQDKINPFGSIFYYNATASVAANTRPSATALWQQYAIALGYSFNNTGAALTLTSWKPVYLKCAPQTDGSAIIDSTTPYVQDLPTTEDGKIYIFLGIAYNATSIELQLDHPVYWHKDGMIRPYTNAPAGGISSVAWGGITGTLSNQSDLNTALGAKANSADLATVATSGSYNDLSNKPTIPTVNNATLTIQKNSTNVATFTANASSNVTANISVPTATSDLTNDSGFITSITKITNAEIDAIMGVS